jgi:hypothetical protein
MNQWLAMDSRDVGVRVLLGGIFFFSIFHSIQTDTEVHPVSYPMGTEGSFPDGKAAGVWSSQLPPISA